MAGPIDRKEHQLEDTQAAIAVAWRFD
jgi:hypothetical protein